MSTQTGFDLNGLSRAIHARDCAYHLALYAADARVEILDATHSNAPLQVLQGRPAIREWLDGRSSPAVHYEVKDAVVHPDRVSYTEECRYADGSNVLFECSAQICRGQITSATVRLINIPCDRSAPAPAQATATGTLDDQPRHALRQQAAARGQEMVRNLAGNYLG
jgi:hypothetical protein